MLQRGTIPTVSSTAVELGESWQNSLRDQWGDVLRGLLQLPTTARGFLVYFAGLTVVCGALAIYVLLSVQIMDAELRMAQLENELARIEQTNSELIYGMVQKTSMAQMNRRALDEGYIHEVQRLYVSQPTVGQATVGLATQATVAPPSTEAPPAPLVTAQGDSPTAFGREMARTVGAASVAAVDYVTLHGERFTASAATQSQRAREWLTPYWERATDFVAAQWNRIDQRMQR